MIGPGWFGYVDADQFLYGEKGGRFLNAWAHVFQEPLSPTGTKRLPVWSELKTDDIVVACPSDMAFRTVEDWDNESLIWVHKISRDPKHWRHDRHPMTPIDFQGVFEDLKRLVDEKGIKCLLPRAPSRLSIPVLDTADGKAKMWSVSSTSQVVQDLIKRGVIRQTPNGHLYLSDDKTVTVQGQSVQGMGPLSFEDLQKKLG
jgi:hypothetical protein